MTIMYPGQDDKVLQKSEVARFGTSSQSKIPVIQFAARKTVINHHGKIQRDMNVHQRDQCSKERKQLGKGRTIHPRIPTSPISKKYIVQRFDQKENSYSHQGGRKRGQKANAKQHRPTPHSKMKISNWQHKNKKHARLRPSRGPHCTGNREEQETKKKQQKNQEARKIR